MRISLEWLSDYCNIEGLEPQAIADALTNSGLEVESIEQSGCRFTAICVAKTLTMEPHPNTDKLQLVTVSLGGEIQTVVCGADNVRAGIFVAFAREGSTVINKKDNSLLCLGRVKIRGVESAGMICSVAELGLSDQYPASTEGIWILDGLVNDSHLGKDLKQVLNLASDTVLEVAPTANRGDLMSVMGVAREVSALFNRSLTVLPNVLASSFQVAPAQGVPLVNVNLSDPDVCSYYSAAVLGSVTVAESPAWLSKRLEASGVRSINNVVDITNYVMLEMGNPLHAFDCDKLLAVTSEKSLDVDVRLAKQEAKDETPETLSTLDGVSRQLTDESVVVTANHIPVALAGVMGGLETEVDENTRSLMLESACFPSATTRKSAKSVALRSEASARFERGVAQSHCKKALARAIELLVKHAGATVLSFVDAENKVFTNSTIVLKVGKVEKLLGMHIPTAEMVRILEQLGFKTLQPDPKADVAQLSELTVEVPDYRAQDVTRDIDLIEEIIRIYGYDKVPYTLPEKTAIAKVSPRSQALKRINAVMQAKGLHAVVTTSLIGDSLLKKTGFLLDERQTVSVLNSHSSDHTVMRQSLLPNILEVTQFNFAQGNDVVWVYELGRTYHRVGKSNVKHSGVSERLNLSGLITGNPENALWQNTSSKKESASIVRQYYQLKGILEQLFSVLGLPDDVVQFNAFGVNQSPDFLHPGQSACLTLEGNKKKAIGHIGVLHPRIQKQLRFRQAAVVFELNVEMLVKAIIKYGKVAQLQAISPYPPVQRDVAFSAPVALSHQLIQQFLQQANEPLLRSVELFDEYKSEQLGSDKRSLAYRLTFQSAEETMTDQDIDRRLNALKQSMQSELEKQQFTIEFR